MSPASSRRSYRTVSTSPARLDFELRLATSSSKRRRKKRFGKGSKRVKTNIEPGNKKRIRFEQPRFAQDAQKQHPPSVSLGSKFSRLPPKPKQPRHGQKEDSVQETMSVCSELRRCPAEVDDSAVFERNSRLPLAVQDNILESRNSTLVSVLRFAFIIKERQTVSSK